MNKIHIETPLGLITVESDGESITKVNLPGTSEAVFEDGGRPAEVLEEAKIQIQEYFSGKRKEFELPLKTQGTAFQMKVWEALRAIPYGASLSYAEIAEAAGSPKAVRAVGQANKANKLPILIPCHRVIGKNRSLTGYAGTQTDLKAVMLDLEKIAYKI
ncbi:methylated-DNA--[protein]-cysteine S-methyltransferase [Bacillus mangrovi]|uniref:Methylated-DNA--protein-cysteine methyltransferase n=1 Tax=Metabacillus mangrovi TaxID=1491830 RepID=A0A7X2S5Z4_9BACI|nr:methylated-DNA--[protein]-cysteine S-methyltransferase [Metabacillus mangrovi]MTH54294.1 methylated-DNA--[protein]-cysteine S-methyltransferase [Metabacillus mangrovi]